MSHFEFKYNPYSMYSREQQYRQWLEDMQMPLKFCFTHLDFDTIQKMTRYVYSYCSYLRVEAYVIDHYEGGKLNTLELSAPRIDDAVAEIKEFYSIFFPGQPEDTADKLSNELNDPFKSIDTPGGMCGGISSYYFMKKEDLQTWDARDLVVCGMADKDDLTLFTDENLEEYLQRCIDEEKYELAADIRNEIERRRQHLTS